jgi:sn-glycerol 3-phosphate transport system substrate-binding protein
MRKKHLTRFLHCAAALALLSTTAACSTTSQTASVSQDTSSTAASADGRIEINFWHSMGGSNQNALLKIVDGFNASQDTYVINAVNQGKYDESTGKFFSMNGGEGTADIIQIGEQNLQSMIDSGLIEDVGALCEEYQCDTSDLLPQMRNFYTSDGVLYAMPFNASSPVFYYNADMFAAAGYEECPSTLEGLREAIRTVQEQNPDTIGFGLITSGYTMIQEVTNLGGYTVNNENGRSSRATEVTFQDKLAIFFNWLADLQSDGTLANYGSDQNTLGTAFSQNKVASFMVSSAGARAFIDSAPFTVGIAALPVPEGTEPEGVYGGGGALCVSAGLSDEKRAGVAAFLAYAISPEVQAQWATDTGYFPASTAAYDTDIMKQTYAEYPQMRVAADQLLNSKVNSVTAGPLVAALPQIYTDVATAAEAVVNGTDVTEAIDAAAQSINEAIKASNAGQ